MGVHECGIDQTRDGTSALSNSIIIRGITYNR
jgi:hypothetical protein